MTPLELSQAAEIAALRRQLAAKPVKPPMPKGIAFVLPGGMHILGWLWGRIIKDFNRDMHMAQLAVYRIWAAKAKNPVAWYNSNRGRNGYARLPHQSETDNPKAVRAWISANLGAGDGMESVGAILKRDTNPATAGGKE